MKSTIRNILVVLSVSSIWACQEEITGNGDEDPPAGDDSPTLVAVHLAPATDTLTELGATLQLTAVARDDSGRVVFDRSYEWTSADTMTATVSVDGLVTAVGKGMTTITASTAGLSDTAYISVMGPFVTLSTGILHTCARAIDGRAYCWGENELGEFGNGSSREWSALAVPVSTDLTFDSLTGGVRYTCGLEPGGEAHCWGYNLAGALGDGTGMNNRLAPVAVLGDLAFGRVDAGGEHTCGRTAAGEAYCWGHAGFGRLGITEQDSSYYPTPMLVAGGLKFADVSAGELHSCGLTDQGEPYCWGENGSGAVGDNTTTDRSTPVPVAGNLSLASISAGSGFTCGLTPAGEAFCWGSNNVGQLGDGTANDRLTPVPVTGSLQFESISAGLSVTCGLTADGDAYCWGKMFEGDLGQNTIFQSSTPELVPGDLEFAYVSASTGYKHACGLTTFGHIYCWGDNERGLLGDGTEVDSLDPVRVVSPLAL